MDEYPIGFFAEISSQNEYYMAYPTLEHAWLYIAIDIRDLSICKIGLTTKKHPQLRLNEGKTYNPFLELYAIYELSATTWGCSQKELNDIESYIHHRNVFGGAIKYPNTLRDSEWFFISPDDAEFQVDWILAKRGFSVQGWTLYDTGDRTYLNEHQKRRVNGVHFEAMREIKTIFRPNPYFYLSRAQKAGMVFEQIEPYINYLVSFHNSDWIEKIYLK